VKTPILRSLIGVLICSAGAPCLAQHPAALQLPVLPPTAAAAGMAHQQAQMLAALDTNKNGRLDPAEIEAAQAGLISPAAGQGGANPQASANMAAFQKWLLGKFDANGNGMLDLPEIEAARLALNMAAMGRNGQGGYANPMNGQFNGANPMAPGEPIKKVKKPKPKPKRKNSRIAQFDKDGDGKLNAEERKAMENAKPQARPKKNAAKPKAAEAAPPAADQ
jgi:hypothetical protein